MNRDLLKTFFKAYPVTYKLVWRENLFLSFIDIFHGLSFAVLIIVTQRFFDAMAGYLGGKEERNVVVFLAILLILCQIFSQVLNGFVNFYADVVREKGYGRVCAMLWKKIEKIAPVNFEKNSFLDDVNKADQGAQQACGMVDTVNSIFTFYVPYFALMGFYMYHLNAVLVLAVLLVFLPVLLTNYVQVHFGNAIEQEIAPVRREAEAYEKTLTTLDSYKETKVLAAARYFINLFKDSMAEWNRISWGKRKKEALINLGLNVFSFLAYGGILLMLVRFCVSGQISVGSFAAVFSAIDVMFLLMAEIFRDSLGDVSKNMGCIKNLLDLLGYEEDRQESVTIGSNEIVLKDITFRYPEAERDCLNGISLKIRSNELVAVVGENGSGKTTLSKVLMGIYKPDRGEVVIGGRKMGKGHHCFPNISAVFQKFNRYKLNLEDNIVISDLSHKEGYTDALDKVDQNLHIDDQVILSRDFDGIDLSGGQWQKIAIARGIHRNAEDLQIPKIMVLDEPTSAIDPMQESGLYHTFLNIAKNKTCIIITHRLGLARIADRVIVLKDGKIVENGNHQELLEEKGEYFKMWSAQAQWYHEVNI